FTLTNTVGLTGISPASGSTAGGNTVTLSGAGFGTSTNTQVLVDGTAIPAAHLSSVTGTQIVFTAPAHAAGSVSVGVKVNGTALAGSPTYTYGAVNPLPGAQPTGGTVGAPSAVPGARPSASSDGTAPTPLPPARP